MAVTPDELRDRPSAVEIIRVQTAEEVERSLALAAAGFGVRAELIRPVYTLDFIQLAGWAYYLAHAEGEDVSVAAGFTVNGSVGIFNVATPAEHRGRGYGGAITARAVREGFDGGAEFAYLESSTMGESVYRRLGFREVETYTILARPSKVSTTS
jgi:GNAT superfamily N-acetyltransferase